MAEVSPLVLDALARVHHYAFTRIQESAISAAIAWWLEFTTGELGDEERWLAGLWSVVDGAGRVAAYETAAYLQTQLDYTGIAPRMPVPEMEWLRGDFDRWAVTPLREVARRLAEEPDIPYERIIRETVPMIHRLTDTVIRTVEIETVDQIVAAPLFQFTFTFTDVRPEDQFRPLTPAEAQLLADQLNGKHIVKQYQRVTQAGACGWCRVVASRLYSHGATLRGEGWHASCRCTWRQVTPEEAATFTSPLAGGRYQDVIKERADTGEME